VSNPGSENLTSVQPAWYQNFFHGLALELWRRAIPDDVTRKECAFLREELKLAAGASVLDVPCGLGRHSMVLAADGIQVTGIDLSPEAIDSARKQARSAGIQVEWLNCDMCGIPSSRIFDAAFCMGNSFGYLSDEDNARFIAGVAGALKTGARFVLETAYAAESLLPHLGKHPPRYDLGDLALLLEHHYDAENSRLNTCYSFVQSGMEDKRYGTQAVYTVRELKKMLAAAGLRVLAMYGGIDRSPYELGSPDLVIVSERGLTAD
jgi:SAM-dependent methyltransferase